MTHRVVGIAQAWQDRGSDNMLLPRVPGLSEGPWLQGLPLVGRARSQPGGRAATRSPPGLLCCSLGAGFGESGPCGCPAALWEGLGKGIRKV